MSQDGVKSVTILFEDGREMKLKAYERYAIDIRAGRDIPVVDKDGRQVGTSGPCARAELRLWSGFNSWSDLSWTRREPSNPPPMETL